jgi:hypothetical protein
MPTYLVRPRVFSFASLALLAGCASPGTKSDLTKRIEQNGYSFQPPGQDGWFIASRSPDRITLAKAGRMEGETYLLEGSELDLTTRTDATGLVEFAADLSSRSLPPPRFRIREQDTTNLDIANAQCAMTHIVAEDRDPGTGSNVLTAMLLDTVSTVCRHPSNPDLGILMTFTHRSFPEDRDRAFEAYAQSVLQTQQFSPVDAQATN